MQKYSYLLAWAAAGIDKPLADLVMVDYGGGSGLLSLLGREMGIGTVLYTDIYNVSCRDAQLIGSAVGNLADRYVTGSLKELQEVLADSGICCDMVVSYDVIEHIYDIDDFFVDLSKLSATKLSVALASGANSMNPFIRHRLRRLHEQIEQEDRPPAPGHKERDSLAAYRTLREQIVRDFAPDLTVVEVAALARATRGLVKPAIENVVEAYKRSGKITVAPDHPSNTCDPYTGNWAERLLDPERLALMLADKGFVTSVRKGAFGHYDVTTKRLIAATCNGLSRLCGEAAMAFAPFYTILGKKNSSDVASWVEQ